MTYVRGALILLMAAACHHESEPTATGSRVPPATPGSAAPGSAATGSAAAGSAAAVADAIAVPFDTETHFKSGGRGNANGVVFTVRMLPKLIVSGPQPEIEQMQLDCERGSEHGMIQLTTVHKSAEWGGVVFELGYADVYHDDIELTVHRK
jgi:hypothetical protein